MKSHLADRSHLSRHARLRSQQRSIPAAVIDYLLCFGDSREAGTGVESFYFSKRSWKRLASYLGQGAAALERYRNCYVVVASGTVVTAAFRDGPR